VAGHRGAAALPLPTLQAGGGRLKPRRRLGLGFRLGVVAPPSPPSFCQFPPSSQPRKLGAILCPDGFYPHKISLYGFISLCHCVCRVCVWLALCRLSCVCAALCYWICCLWEVAKMWLKSFSMHYGGRVNGHIFLRGAPPRTPLGARPPNPRVRP